MSDRVYRSAFRSRIEALLEQVQNPARLVGGEIGAGPGFREAAEELRVVLAFPDAYEIGISNQALQILYEVAGRIEGVGVERTFVPWVDVSARLSAEDIPMPTLETWSPVASAHVLGISLQHELNFTNVLELLSLSHIPLRSRERSAADPLILGGGPAAANFFPVAPFLDAVVVGDGERVFEEVLLSERQSLEQGRDRRARKAALAELDGVYVPGVSKRVRRRVESDLQDLPYPVPCLVPLTEGVHDRAWVEVMRGCTRGCRFCQAGMWYRPVRERPPADVLRLAGAELEATGYDELALGSLSTTDYSGLEETLDRLAAEYPGVQVSLPSLRVDSAAVRLGHQTSRAGSSVTLAPEAGSQRLRDVINKNVTEEDIVGAVREAVRLGRTTIKLYFMIGLPTECDEDVQAIVDLCRMLRDVAEELREPGQRRVRLNVSVSNFIPKPFTPFQWTGMAPREILERRHRILREGLRGKWADLSLHDIEPSYVEGALARGGEDLAEVIEAAWRRGARFDSWTDQYDSEAWRNGFAASEASAEGLARRHLSLEQEPSWARIDTGISEQFLRREWEKAQAGARTPDCRWESCPGCGVCTGETGLRVGESQATAVRHREARADESAAVRYVFRLAVRGRSRFLGHLDRLEVLRRAVRRAGGRPALSDGMRPKPLMSLAVPLAVGVESEGEVGELSLAEVPSGDFPVRLAGALPEGMELLSLEPYNCKAVTRRVAGVRYRVELARDLEVPCSLSDLREAAGRYTRETEIHVERIRPQKRRLVNVRSYVDEITLREKDMTVVLEFAVRVTPQGSARPEEVVEALSQMAGRSLVPKRTVRTEILLDVASDS